MTDDTDPPDPDANLTPDLVDSPAFADTPALGGEGSGFDLGAVMEMAMDMQRQVADAQQSLAEAEVVGTAGGSLVSVTLNGHLQLTDVRIEPAAMEEDASIVADLVRAAWQDAFEQVSRLQQAADPLGGLGGDGGLDGLTGPGGLLGGLGGALGEGLGGPDGLTGDTTGGI